MSEEQKEETLSTDEIAQMADDKTDALINLLVKKKIITEDEFEKEYEGLFEEE